ncbi:5'/3'-nucleotidase SurE [Candidatus Chlorohelix sp.]|uniref:5'/3'-nucleotidase SurE n=1 Tax=Candidatus Chlorohelix sp. TaxID=3139201 RepID=UPI00304F9466
MHILLTNDDGIDSQGLRANYDALVKIPGVQVSVIAPDHNWSVSGHNKTMDRPLRVREVKWWGGSSIAFSTDGTPADCVSIASLGFLETPPDLVVSGINTGPNLGDDVTYSGTVAAAMEAHIAGFAAIAVSLDAYSNWHFETASNFIADLVMRFQSGALKLKPDNFWNINVPNLLPEQIKGVTLTRQGRRIYTDELHKRTDPRGSAYYWIGGERPGGIPGEGTDIEAITQGKISITPLMLDLTNYKALEEMQGWKI